ncbi:MAG: 2-hydroxyacyl-CoA dehydratase family protein, partial [Firmicutes bacterium]|nr:2-hydroxyacyl-CoA dehydratase family protein [Bacillota bacterium]
AVRLLDALAREIEEVAAQPPPSRPGRARVAVSGGFLETEDVLRLIEESGADVVGDDLCLGGRRRAWTGSLSGRGAPAGPVRNGPAGSDGDPFLALADKYLGRVNCPCKHPPEGRFEAVGRLAAECGAQGVVFLLQKFCDPHAFDFPDLRRRLEGSGRPVLLLEVERGVVPEGQARTRLEAFVERLGGVRA